MENRLGKSIVKAAWIFAFAAVICMIIYGYSNRYTTLGERAYIDNGTGVVHSVRLELEK
jgi:hypothetical protein